MTDHANPMDDQEPPQREHIKVKRDRRRLYEPPPSVEQEAEAPHEAQVAQEHLPAVTPAVKVKSLEAQANIIVRDYSWGGVVLGLLPVPLFDFVVLSGIQIKMLHSMSKLYGVEFKAERGKAIVAALLSGIPTSWMAVSSYRFFPFAGIFGFAAAAASYGAVTWAVGKVFIQHFEAGGTFLDFDPEKVREHFRKLYEEGKQIEKGLAK